MSLIAGLDPTMLGQLRAAGMTDLAIARFIEADRKGWDEELKRLKGGASISGFVMRIKGAATHHVDTHAVWRDYRAAAHRSMR